MSDTYTPEFADQLRRMLRIESKVDHIEADIGDSPWSVDGHLVRDLIGDVREYLALPEQGGS